MPPKSDTGDAWYDDLAGDLSILRPIKEIATPFLWLHYLKKFQIYIQRSLQIRYEKSLMGNANFYDIQISIPSGEINRDIGRISIARISD